MKLHHTLGTVHALPCGIVECHGLFFVDNGFGEYERTDRHLSIAYLVNGSVPC